MTPEQIEHLKTMQILKHLNSKEELRDWMYLYFDIKFPMNHVYPTSNSSPIEFMWEIYRLMKTGDSQYCRTIILLSARDAFKTLGAAAIEVLCMIHFELPLANAGAILQQSQKALEYIGSFFRKVEPYLLQHGWKSISENSRKITWTTPNGSTVYLSLLVMTSKSMNGDHVPMFFLDEADLVTDLRAFAESSMIPSTYGKYFPLTVHLSTMKYSGGLFSKIVDEASSVGGKVLRWNIIDVTERITHAEARIDEPKVIRYITIALPMSNISPEEFNQLSETNKNLYERFEAYAGIAEHPFLPVMRNYLVDRDQDDFGYLYKPLRAVMNNFKATTTDMAEAQLLCNRPSSSNLVYPRFNSLNTLSPTQVYERITGEEQENDITFDDLKNYMCSLGCTFVGGCDWGWSDQNSFVVMALMPNGDMYLMDHLLEGKLEPDDVKKRLLIMQKDWDVQHWFADSNRPDLISMLKKAGLKFPSFIKEVGTGISALQSRIVDSMGVRRFFVVDIPSHKFLINGFGKYKWDMDGMGNIVEGKPYHDRDGVSDTMDSLRYPYQVLFGLSKNKHSFSVSTEQNNQSRYQPKSREESVVDYNNGLMRQKIGELTGGGLSTYRKQSGKKRIIF